MKVLFTKVDHVPAHASRVSIQDGCTPAKTPTSTLKNKRSHVPSSTQQRLIKTKLEDALMSGRDESAACASVTNESDDMYAIDCMESPDLQTPCDTNVASVPEDIIKAPRPCPWRRHRLGRVRPYCPGSKIWLGCCTDRSSRCQGETRHA